MVWLLFKNKAIQVEIFQESAMYFTKYGKCNFYRKLLLRHNEFSFEVSTFTINLRLKNFCENDAGMQHCFNHTISYDTGYVVEKCEDGKDFWEKVPGIVTGTSHPVKGLKEGKKYKFRVKAENRFGAGEPLETDKPTLAKNPFGKIFFC